MAAPSTELNTSTTSNITFAASPEPKKSEDTAALLQLELIEQIKVYNEQKTKKTKIVKKAYRSGKRDITLEEIAHLSPEEQLQVLLEHHKVTGKTTPDTYDIDDDDDITMPTLMPDEPPTESTAGSSNLETRVRPPPRRYRTCKICKEKDLEQMLQKCTKCHGWICLAHQRLRDKQIICANCASPTDERMSTLDDR